MSKALSDYCYADELEVVKALLKAMPENEAQAKHIRARAIEIIVKIRKRGQKIGELESFLQQYSLSTEEGIALMCLAEALLRIPDAKTANALIHDKVEAANWLQHEGKSKDWVVKAAGVGLLVTRKTLESAVSRLGEPLIREAMVRAMQILGKQFVLGRTIDEAVQNGKSWESKGYRMSYDMLGEGARTAIDAEHYFDGYNKAIDYIGQRIRKDAARKPGISVKLSALHPRFSFAQRHRCVPEIAERLQLLCDKASSYDMCVTVDAEECDRLEISLEIIESIMQQKALKGWEGFGLAVQAYQKRAIPLLDHLAVEAKSSGRRLQVRLVKGAYWDAEVKRAQVLGLPEYPVFTRKSNTDLSYQACAAKLFGHKDLFYPMLGTHNAQTAAAIIEMARARNATFELQRLHGMGEALYEILLQDSNILPSIYAPVGSHEDLLAYLVRRLLENGANSSFVNRILDTNEAIEDLAADPATIVREQERHRHPKIPLPKNIYGPTRRNSKGLDLTHLPDVNPVKEAIKNFKPGYMAMPLIGGKIYKDMLPDDVFAPQRPDFKVGQSWPGNRGLIDKAFRVAGESFESWSGLDAEKRATILEKIADIYERNMHELMALCVMEAGKTIPDALAEVREAVDFCRYYAQQGRLDFASHGTELDGPTGEENILTLHGRGVFVCISPWNFPLAIFTGQVVAALMAGNCVIAKPAEQTPLIAARAVQFMHEAGIPVGALNLMPGDGHVGAALVQHDKIAGVVFTGSNAVAKSIHEALSEKPGPIAPLIAETGGLNAMIVDSSALPEKVVDDVVLSAFGSTGQRCSALRILYLQEDIADKVLRMLQGAMDELRMGDPAQLSTDIGPVIDEEALNNLTRDRAGLDGYGEKIAEVIPDRESIKNGYYFAPCTFELPNIEVLEHETFGPVLHVVRFAASKLDDVIDDINAKGFGLTLGIHTRIDTTRDHIIKRARVGNIYVNRSMIGAVVGVQPFGGMGKSGTGPKAGGPHYLPRFATEKAVSIDTTAAGGNASLVTMGD